MATNPSSSLQKSVGCYESNRRKGTCVLWMKEAWNWAASRENMPWEIFDQVRFKPACSAAEAS